MKNMYILAILFALIAMSSASVAVMASPIDHTAPSPMMLAEATKIPSSQSDTNNQKIAQAIADAFKVPVADILALHDKNMGYGEIVVAYTLAQKSGKSVSEVLALRTTGQGWGTIAKTFNPEHAKLTKLGQVLNGKQTAKTDAPGNSGEHRQDTTKGKDDKSENANEQDSNKNDNKGKDGQDTNKNADKGNDNNNNPGNDKGKGK